MKTDDFVKLLAAGPDTVVRHQAAKSLSTGLGLGTLGAATLMLTFLHVRADLAEAVWMPTYWAKIGFVGLTLLISLVAVVRASKPGRRFDGLLRLLMAPVLVMWLLGSWFLWEAEPAQRASLFFGNTWKVCPLLIAMLSMPVFVGVIVAMRSLAPTNPRRAGFVAGALSGATAALVYSLHCPESQIPFIAFWYLLGMLIPAVAGGLLGTKLLRW